jgi:serine/threonine protein kinase/tetratricopeptide (TPR) repeat protein
MNASESAAETIFFAAMQRAEPEGRARYVEDACAGDAALRARVERLLAAHPKVGSFLESPATDLTVGGSDVFTGAAPAVREIPGMLIGPYKLLEQIGTGGMAVVFLAEQTRPIQRKVALKVIKPGMDSRQVIARFEAERQALALMDHPNIAKVLDAGTTDSGGPYFVMELVKGVPITMYCDEHHLTPSQRLELFVQVCSAVQHAHQKGIIHRDLKPTNVLVALYDGMPVPKVIDFGIAKATGQQLTERTLFTGFGTVVGTPEYMSPEQAELNQLDVDTRSDVYSLGVLLYELLTGTTPLEHNRFKAAALLEMLRVVREEEPPKPSTRLSTSDQLPSIAASRGLEPKKLSALVHGELDWIVMKSLEKDRARRYETANGLAMDVQRYLNDEAVQACPPSARYRFGKFARRNKAALVAASLVVAALLAGSALATWQAVVATRAKQEAVAAAIAEKTAKVTAEAREAETRAVLEFVQNKVFAAARPLGQEGGLGREVTLRKAVEAAVPFVENSFTNQPLVEARLRMTLGISFYYLGDAKAAAVQLESARALCARHRGPNHPDTLKCMSNLALVYADLGRHTEALELREETLALQKSKIGPHHLDTLKSMHNLANSYAELGRHDEALVLREEALALEKTHLGPDDPLTLVGMNNLAHSYDALGRHADATKVAEESLALMKAKVGPDHPDTLTVMTVVANSYSELGRLDDALKLREEILALQRAKLGPDHPSTFWGMNNLAISYSVAGRHAEALALREDALARRRARLGSNHTDTLDSMHNLAYSYATLGRHAEALALRDETLTLRKAQLGLDHPDTLRSMTALAITYDALDRHADALKLHEETLTLRQSKLGPDHPDTLASMWRVAESLVKLERGAEAVPIIDECVRRAAGKDVPPRLIADAMDLRLRYFQKVRNPAGCLETASMWEALKRTDAQSLYQSASFRAASAAVINETDDTPRGEANATEQADQAMAWLTQAVAGGYKDADHTKIDKNLDALRGREDFKRLLAELPTATTSTTAPISSP